MLVIVYYVTRVVKSILSTSGKVCTTNCLVTSISTLKLACDTDGPIVNS